MTYLEQKRAHEKEVSEFPMFFAFSSVQFAEGLAKKGWKEEDLVRIPGGGLIRRDSQEEFIAMFKRHTQELKSAMEDDAFLQSALEYELANFEYCYTGDPTDALDALGLSAEDPRVAKVLAGASREE